MRIHDNKPHMIFHHEGHSWCLPVVSKHDYLGAHTQLHPHGRSNRY